MVKATKENKIIRSFDRKLSNLRALDDGKTIEGYAIVFNQRSLLVTDFNLWKGVIEIISPDAISDNLLRSSDVICDINHEPDRLLARCVNGSGSLTLTKDDTGVKFSFQVANTPDGQAAYEGVKRGDFSGCSFEYFNDEDEVNVTYSKETDKAGNVTIIRTVNTIDHLLDVSIVLYPAYPQTSVDARSQETDFIEKEIKRAMPDDFKPAPAPVPEDHTPEMRADIEKLDKIINS